MNNNVVQYREIKHYIIQKLLSKCGSRYGERASAVSLRVKLSRSKAENNVCAKF